MRYLMRLAKTRFDEWVNGSGDAKILAESVFRPTKAYRKEFRNLLEDSTYFVQGPLEEVRAVAAHLLTGNDPKMETRYLIRILLSDAEEAGLQVDDSSIGKTGVPWVDFRHRDLVGTKKQFQRLVEVILRYVQEGQDRIRRVGSAQDEVALRYFAGLPATERPTHTRDVINCVLSKTSILGLNPDIALARAELVNLAIPEEIISLRAFCLQRDGKGTGSMPKDWEIALKELRDEYAKQFLQTINDSQRP